MKRILIINVNWLGDVLFTTPFIRAIRKRYPDSYIACMIVPRCMPIIEHNQHLNEIIIYDERGRHRSLRGKWSLIKLLRSRRFDAAFILHRSFTRALIAFLSGIKIRIGYDVKKRGILLTDAIEHPRRGLHKVDYFLNIAGRFGTDTFSKDYEFFISGKDTAYITGLLKKQGISKKDRFLVINPGGNWDPKRWPPENFARLADMLARELKLKVVISGAEKDVELAEGIARMMKGQAAILAGKTSLRQLAALMRSAALVIANDSGPMHIAVSMKAKVISLFGPTSSRLTGPYGRGHYTVLWKDIGCTVPCYNRSCDDNRCMKAITPEDVLEEARRIL